MNLFRVATPHREVWLNLSDISSIETPGSAGKPRGWSDECAAAAVSVRGRTDVVVLDAEQWKQLRRQLGLPEPV